MIIRGCIFDLGGTIIDKYSITPLVCLKEAFSKNGINIKSSLIRKDMGLNKMDHIERLCQIDTVKHQWYKNYGTLITDKEKENIFKDFSKIQRKETIENMKIIPQTYNFVKQLQNMNIKIGVTTGFDKEQMDRIKSILESNGVKLDNYVSSTCLDRPGRPHPYMIYENMKELDLDDPRRIIKIDDTATGIKEGLNAGCWSIGVARWSINMNIDTYEEMNEFEKGLMKNNNYSDNYYQMFKKINYSKRILEKSGAHYVIRNLGELIKIIEDINSMKVPVPILEPKGGVQFNGWKRMSEHNHIS